MQGFEGRVKELPTFILKAVWTRSYVVNRGVFWEIYSDCSAENGFVRSYHQHREDTWHLFRWSRWSETEVTQSCLTLCDPMNCSLPGSSVHGVFQARGLEWGAISFSRRSFWPRDQTRVSRIVGRCFAVWATREVKMRWRQLI